MKAYGNDRATRNWDSHWFVALTTVFAVTAPLRGVSAQIEPDGYLGVLGEPDQAVREIRAVTGTFLGNDVGPSVHADPSLGGAPAGPAKSSDRSCVCTLSPAGWHPTATTAATQAGSPATCLQEVVHGTSASRIPTGQGKNGVQPDATSGGPAPSVADSGAHQLPDWFEQARVQVHTRLSVAPNHVTAARGNRSAGGRDGPFWTAGQRMATLGVSVMTRHIKSGDEIFGRQWDGASVPASSIDWSVAKYIINEAHNNGVRVILYYWHMADAWVQTTHPAWLARDLSGRIVKERRGTASCLNSPFADLVIADAVRLIELGADGLYYDYFHMPRGGCWCGYCRLRFVASNHRFMPSIESIGNSSREDLVSFNQRTIERFFERLQSQVHKVNPEAVIVASADGWLKLQSRHLSERLLDLADSPKIEFNSGVNARDIPEGLYQPPRHVLLGFSFDLARDAANGRPAHTWINDVNGAEALLYATSGVVSHGNIANLDMSEHRIPDHDFTPAFSLGRQVSAQLSGLRPQRCVAIHVSEELGATLRLRAEASGLRADTAADWRGRILPAIAAYEALQRDGIPATLVTDRQIRQRQWGGGEGHRRSWV
jgi:hypothetical protein